MQPQQGKNKHGLGRYIPEDVRRRVRQRDGFGCVICAIPFVEYEHVVPEFADAKKHDPECITLLCPTCHARVTRNQLSKQMILEAMKKPAAKEKGTVADLIYFSDNHPTVIFGGATFVRCNIPLLIKDTEIVSIKYIDGKYLLSMQLWDSNGNQTLTIVDNEWSVSGDAVWDLKVESNRIIIKEQEKEPSLTIKVVDNKIFTIEKLDMLIGNVRIAGNADYFQIGGFTVQSFNGTDCHIGFHIG